MTIINEQQQAQSPSVETLQQKIDEFAIGIRSIQDIFLDRKKTIRQQLRKIIQLASDLSIDDMQLREMISESCTRMGVSPSWLRKLLPQTLKLTKHTRKDYLKLQLQRDQHPLQQRPQQQHKELLELPTLSSSRHTAVEQWQQPSDNGKKIEAITKVPTYDDNSIAVIPQLAQKENEGLVEESDDKNKIIEKLNEKIEELQEEIRYLLNGSSAQRQQHQQEEEAFTALGYLQLFDNDVPIKVTVNVKTKSIEAMEIAHEIIHDAKTYQ